MQRICCTIAAANKEWGDITMQIGMRAMQNPDEVGAAAVDYMYFSGYVTLAYLWARMALLLRRNWLKAPLTLTSTMQSNDCSLLLQEDLATFRSHVDVFQLVLRHCLNLMRNTSRSNHRLE